MDKPTLDFLNLAVDKTKTRAHLESIYANEQHLVALDGYRMHYVDNSFGLKTGFLTPGIDADFPNYRRLIYDKNPDFQLSARALSVTKWKQLLKELKTFDVVRLVGLGDSYRIEAFSGARYVNKLPKHPDFNPIEKRLSIVVPGELRTKTTSPWMHGLYFVDALSPLLTRKRDGEDGAVFLRCNDDRPIQINIMTFTHFFRAVVMPRPIQESADAEQEAA